MEEACFDYESKLDGLGEVSIDKALKVLQEYAAVRDTVNREYNLKCEVINREYNLKCEVKYERESIHPIIVHIESPSEKNIESAIKDFISKFGKPRYARDPKWNDFIASL